MPWEWVPGGALKFGAVALFVHILCAKSAVCYKWSTSRSALFGQHLLSHT